MLIDYFLSLFLKKKQNIMKNKFDRVLPISELVIDRWEKAKYLGFGQGTSIYDSCIVMGNVSVDKNTWIGPNTLLDGTGGELTIGMHCDVSAGVQIYTHDTVKHCVSSGKMHVEQASVHIGDNCYIGPMSVISKGVTLGEKCIVSTNSFVNKSFEPNCVIAGTPAKKIGKVICEKDGCVSLVYTNDC